MGKTALITGITGQDGSYLAELLLEKGYEVFGLIRRSSTSRVERIESLLKKKGVVLCEGDLADFSSLKKAVEVSSPDEIYNLAAMSHVKSSFDMPEYTANVNALGVLRLLEVVRESNAEIRFYQASTSELFGKAQDVPQSEETPFYPRSPYGIAKQYAYWSVVNYREAYGLYACNGILFNHESPRRGENFVSRKITLGVARIFYGLQEKLLLGNLSAKRDWGYAKDFVEGMWRMLQIEQPGDYVLATGHCFSVREFVTLAFRQIGIEIIWEGIGLMEKGVDAATGKILVEVSPEFFRPTEVDLLIGDYSKAKEALGWSPQTAFADLVALMVEHDLRKEHELQRRS